MRCSAGTQTLTPSPVLLPPPDVTHSGIGKNAYDQNCPDRINAEGRNANQLTITKDVTSKDMKSYFCLTIIRIFIKESKTDILRTIKKLIRCFKKME